MKHQHPVTAQALRDRTGSDVAAELGIDLTTLSRWQLAALALEAVELVRMSIDAAVGWSGEPEEPSTSSSPRADTVRAAELLRSLRDWYD